MIRHVPSDAQPSHPHFWVAIVHLIVLREALGLPEAPHFAAWATEPAGELELFHRFLSDQLQNGQSGLSPEESVKALRAYQRLYPPV